MKKDREFDMLENADDKTVELLAEVPVLSKDEKERMLAMSKKKLDMMNRENNIVKNNDEEQVSGVERYNRPKWHRFATMAACLVLVGGLAGTVFVLGRNEKKSDKDSTPMTKVTSTVTGTASTTTDANAVQPQTTTGIIGEGETEVPYLNDEQLLEIAKTGLDNFNMIENIYSGYGVAVDKNDTCKVEFEDISKTYYRVTDDRFSSMDDVNNFVAQYFTGKQLEYSKNPVFFKEMDGKLYYQSVSSEIISLYQIDGEPEISGYNGDSFNCMVPIKWAGVTRGLKLEFSLVDGKWYVSNMDVLDSPDLEEEAPDIETAKRLLKTLSRIESLSACGGVTCDNDDRQEIDDDDAKYIYLRVLDDPEATDFKSSLEDIQSWYDYVCTGDIHEKYKSLCYEDGDYAFPVFKEFDGKLYQLMGGKGTIFNYCSTPTISNVTKDSFDINVKCCEPGINVVPLTVTAVKDGYAWKLSSFNYDYENAYVPTGEEAKEIERYNLAENAMYHVKELLDLAGGGIAIDASDKQIVRASGASVEYYRVLDNYRFQSVQEIENEIETYSAGSFREELQRMMNEDAPVYQDIDGKLYCREDGSYCGFRDMYYLDATEANGKFTVKAEATIDSEKKTLTINAEMNAETEALQVTDYSIEEHSAN